MPNQESISKPGFEQEGVPVQIQPNREAEEDFVPPQYRGLPSEVVEELWQNPIHIDSKKNEGEVRRREKALDQIRNEEYSREDGKEATINESFARLTKEEQAQFPEAQKDAVTVISEYIQGRREKIDGLAPEEEFILTKVKAAYEDYKRELPEAPFTMPIERGIDKKVYDHLCNSMAFEVLESREKERGWEKANKIRGDIGVEAQPMPREDLLLPNTLEETRAENIPMEAGDFEAQAGEEDTPEKKFGEFRMKNGETDTGVFWNEYSNLEAKKLKEAGKFEWGKERIYFDIPIANMEAMRDLSFRFAKENRIAIAFKHLDTAKSYQYNLTNDTTRFVANFVSVDDAKKFYDAISKDSEYQKLKSDRNLDYHGYKIDDIAHYAAGYREHRVVLERIVTKATRNKNGTYSYPFINPEGKPSINTISVEQYKKFKKEYEDTNPEKAWKSAK